MNPAKQILRALLLAVSAAWISHAHDFLPNPAPTGPVLLKNAAIHTVSNGVLPNADLLIENGKIAAIGQNLPLPKGGSAIDLTAKRLYPGLISAFSALGLIEVNAVRASVDIQETGPLNPNVRAESAINPDSELIPVTRANGVLIAHVSPQTSRNGLIGGTTAVIGLDGWTTEDLTLRAPVGLYLNWPHAPDEPNYHPDRSIIPDHDKNEERYQDHLRSLRDALSDARSYAKAKAAQPDSTKVDLRWESLAKVLAGEIPVFAEANSLRQIRDAVQWSRRESLKLVIVGGYDAWRAADLLKENRVSVIAGQANALPRRRWESNNAASSLAAKLHAAGVPFAISYNSGGPDSSNERNLPYEAGKAASQGLPPEEALKAITLYPAQILGIADRVGSLEPGKDATLIITTGDPLDIRTNVESAYLAGRPVTLESRHTQLYVKYKQRYEQLGKQ